jgi:serine/threonine protein phosphatase PrpC
MGNYLKSPKLDKQIEIKSNDRLTSTLVQMQGWRISMEDAHINEPNFDLNSSLFAIFDGHGGSEVALYAQETFPKLLKDNKYY